MPGRCWNMTMAFGFDDPTEELSRVQALRADPPGLAGRGGRRAKVFAASLQQFADLLTAAESVGSASSPILLFYALSQAGRAIAAAHQPGGDLWEFSSHGLKVTEDDHVGKTTVRPEPRRDSGDAFSVITSVTGSKPLAAATNIESMWSSLPGLQEAPGLGVGRPRPLVLEPDPFAMSPFHAPPTTAVVRLPAEVDDEHQAASYLHPYPVGTAKPAVSGIVGNTAGIHPDSPRQYRVDFRCPIATVGEEYLARGMRFLRPSVVHDDESPLALVTWWATLLALASLARYRPAVWTKALDKDDSALAVPLESGLRTARLVLPRLVLHALVGRWT